MNPFAQTQNEQVSYINQNRNNPYGNSYNPNWRNYPNLSWRNNNQNVLRPPMNQGSTENKLENPTLTALTKAMTKLVTNQAELITENKKFMVETRTNINNQAAAIRNLDNQVGQITEKLNNKAQGAWPSNTERNPKECMAITTRSGKQTSEANKDVEKLTSPKPCEKSTSQGFEDGSTSTKSTSPGLKATPLLG